MGTKTPKVKKILIIPDCHIPYHDKKAFSLACLVAQRVKPDVLVIIGDFLDCYTISDHDKSLERKYTLREEVEIGKSCLDRLSRASGAKKKYFCEGNHEERMSRYKKRRAREIYDLVPSIPELLGLKEKGWKWVPYNKWDTIDNLMISHHFGGHGQNSHRKTLSEVDGGFSTVNGHTHQMQYLARTTINGSLSQSAMLGWLGDPKQADYLHAIKKCAWVQGVGLVYRVGKSTFVNPVPFDKGRCVVEGRVLEVR